jgi:phosphate:Na+ symporter
MWLRWGSGVITLEGAIGVILGANIGSCITGLIAALRLGYAARQASFAQILMNSFGVLLFAPFISQFADLVVRTSRGLRFRSPMLIRYSRDG